VVASDIDAYDHVNNAVYLSWFDQVAWSHSTTLGVSLEECVRIRRGPWRLTGRKSTTKRAAVQGRSGVGRDLDNQYRCKIAGWSAAFQVRARAQGGETLGARPEPTMCASTSTQAAPPRMPESFFAGAYVIKRVRPVRKQG